MQVPYHRYWFTEAEEQAVLDVLRSGWLTTGQQVKLFEAEAAAYKHAPYSIGVASCTSALFVLLASLNLGPKDEVITTPFTFAATANTILLNGAKLVLADIDPQTLNIDPSSVAERITPNTRAVVCVHVAGHPCDMDALRALTEPHDIALIEDCAHAFESSYKGTPTGLIGYGGAFSFYPNKNITTGEGGLILCPDAGLEGRLRRLRNHGLDFDSYERSKTRGYKQYDIMELGFKHTMNELQACIGRQQISRLPEMTRRRMALVRRYDDAFAANPHLEPVKPLADTVSAYHLYIVQLRSDAVAAHRDDIVADIMDRGVGLSIAYKPLHLFTYFRTQLGYQIGDLPQAEAAYQRVFSLPLYPLLSTEEQDYAIEVVQTVVAQYAG